MFAGHLAAALALKPVEKRLNLGILFFAALFADFLLGILTLAGVEQVHVPANFDEVHYLTFTFPYSHGLVASVAWALIAFGIVKLAWKNTQSTKAGIVVAIAVFSHFMLDWMVHIPELPMLGDNSTKLGLGLWKDNLTAALTLEVCLVVVGLAIYLYYVRGVKPANRYGIIALMAAMAILTVVGQSLSTSAPPPMGAAATWILETLFLTGTAYWIDRKSSAGAN